MLSTVGSLERVPLMSLMLKAYMFQCRGKSAWLECILAVTVKQDTVER